MTGRSSGILLPIFSLPGGCGVGSLGGGARTFVDFLAAAGQRWWQILPLVPPGSGNSPYMSPSAFAGNPWFLDLEDLARDGLLTPDELREARYPDLDRVDYRWLAETRLPLLRRAWKRGRTACRTEQDAFLRAQAGWLPDHALFTALHAHLGALPLDRWPEPLRRRDPEALEPYQARLADEIDFQVFLQYQFFRQWTALRAYARARGVSILGDLPIYVSADSAEVWAQPRLFQLDEALRPKAAAGVPPDAFSDVGQHWGNPLYDWAGHRQALFTWWVRRMEHAALLYDAVRIDHFRGFHTYWSIPVGASAALEGRWEPGPGQDLVDHLRREVPGLDLIAEDLGDLDEAARDFIAGSGLPGMKILIYAFDPVGESAYLPHNCPTDAVVYTGTHVSGVAKDKNVARLALVGLADEPGIAFKIFSLLAKKKINVDIILQSIGRNSSKDISFTVARSDAEEARAILEENRDYIGFQSIEVNTQVAKVSIVGAGMVNNSGVACKMFEALSSAGINISMISTSEIKVSVLVDERDADRAVQAIHDRFFSEFGNS